MHYQNPILPGSYSDPSVCRVGQNYYLVTSSLAFFPAVPIFHSRDLIHWRQIGHCLTRASQAALADVESTHGIYAPTLRYHQGRFYLTTTLVPHGGNFYVSAVDPAGPWSDPVWVEQQGIDPSLLFDDDGTVYFTSTGAEGIYQSVIDIATGTRLTEPRLIWGGTGGRYPEGPHLYHIHGQYYLMIAEGGTEYGHMETIARSTNAWGPFDACPHNPILTHRDRGGHPIQGLGHADLVEAHDGSWWLVFLGFRPQNRFFPVHHLGRETFLAPVTWTADGWPVVYHNGTVELEMEAAGLPPQPWPPASIRDDFDQGSLAGCWNFIRNPHAEDWSLTARPGWLRLHGSARTLDDRGSPAFVGRCQQHFDCEAAALLDFEPQHDGEEAGLTAWTNEHHHYEVGITRRNGERVVFVRRRIGDLSAVVAQHPIDSGLVTLAITATAEQYTFAFAINDASLHPLATGAARYLTSEVATGFTGVYLGMYATGTGQPSTIPADFDWCTYQGHV